MSDRKSTLTAIMQDQVSGPAKRIQAEITGIGTATSKVNSILQGVGVGIGIRVFDVLTEAVQRLTEALPNLIEGGNTYLEQLHAIQLETGMTAEQASTLVGVTKSLGISTDNLEPLFAKLGKNLGTNEGAFRALGVATRDAKGQMLDAYAIIQNLREQVSKHGEALLSTAAAQTLFGRGGYQLLPLLQQTDAQFAASAANVRRWGGVMSEQAINGAHQFAISLASLQTGILDIGTNIAAALDPYLRAFVDSFSKFVQAHLNDIINFAVAAANAVIGFISGLFGITQNITSAATATVAPLGHAAAATDTFGKSAKTASGGTDAFTASINAQIKAIDAHSQAIQANEDSRHAAAERLRLQQSLAAARGQLSDLQGSSPFVGGLSATEQVLAIQKHAQDIADAKKNVRDQEQSLGNFELDQKDRAERELLNRQKQRLSDLLSAHKTANAAILASGLRVPEGLDNKWSSVLGNIGVKSAQFGKTAADSFKAGSDAAKSFLDVLLGTEAYTTGARGVTHLTRQGGVIGALTGLAGVIGQLGKMAADVTGPIVDVFDTIADALNYVSDTTTNFAIDLHNNIVQPLLNFLNDVKNALASLFSVVPNINIGHHASGGWVGLHGPELSWVGERGPEYITPNDRLGGSGGSGHGHAIYLDGQKVGEAVSRRQYYQIQHAPVTSVPVGSF